MFGIDTLFPTYSDEGLEMAQWLRVLVVPTEDPGSISSNHTMAHSHL